MKTKKEQKHIYVFGYMRNPRYCVDQHRSKICDMLSEQFSFKSIDDYLLPRKTTLFHGKPWRSSLIAYHSFKIRNPSMKHIVTFYGTTLNYRLNKKLVRNSDIITTVSATTMNELIHLFGEADYRLIYDGVNTGFYKPDPTKEYNKRLKALMVITTATRNFKNHRIFIEVARQSPDIDFILRTWTDINQTNLPNNITLIKENYNSINKYGESPGLNNLYNNADVYLFPSMHEGLNNTVLEAMSCGLPIIGFNATSMPELIRNEKNGFLCNNVKEVIDAVDYFSHDMDECIKMGKQSRSIAQWFTWERCCDGFKNIYKEMIE